MPKRNVWRRAGYQTGKTIRTAKAARKRTIREIRDARNVVFPNWHRLLYAKAFVKEARKLLGDNLKAVYVSSSVASKSAALESDIDLLFIVGREIKSQNEYPSRTFKRLNSLGRDFMARVPQPQIKTIDTNVCEAWWLKLAGIGAVASGNSLKAIFGQKYLKSIGQPLRVVNPTDDYKYSHKASAQERRKGIKGLRARWREEKVRRRLIKVAEKAVQGK